MRFAFKCALPAIALVVLPSAAALADPDNAPGSPAPEPLTIEPEPKADKKVCKTVTITGSRLPGKKVCKTKEEWDAEAALVQEDLRSQQRSSRMPDR